jgi:prephenate dehydrogenase
VNTAAIVGVGLIGGSFALALRKAGYAGRIVGVSSPPTLRAARERGVIDEGLPLQEAAASADLLYLAQPVERIIETLGAIDQYVRPGTLITDAGSTKVAIVEAARQSIRRGRFIGGHPMAGKETRGVEQAEADLFQDRPYVLTGRDAELEDWIERIGARLVVLTAEQHDRLVALTSHLPQLISMALALLIAEEPDAARVAGPAALEFTRLALSPYEIWRDILSTNAESIDAALGACISRLESLRTKLRSAALEDEFKRAKQSSQSLRNVGRSG